MTDATREKSMQDILTKLRDPSNNDPAALYAQINQLRALLADALSNIGKTSDEPGCCCPDVDDLGPDCPIHGFVPGSIDARGWFVDDQGIGHRVLPTPYRLDNAFESAAREWGWSIHRRQAAGEWQFSLFVIRSEASANEAELRKAPENGFPVGADRTDDRAPPKIEADAKATALALGFTYWPGGDAEPDDFDPDQTILLRDGIEFTPWGNGEGFNWSHNQSGKGECPSDIIGYHRKVESAPEFAEVCTCPEGGWSEDCLEHPLPPTMPDNAFQHTHPYIDENRAKKRDSFAMAAAPFILGKFFGAVDYGDLVVHLFDFADSCLAESEKRAKGDAA